MTTSDPNQSSEAEPLPRRMFLQQHGVLLASLGLVIVAILLCLKLAKSHDDWLSLANRSYIDGDYQTAESFARRALSQESESVAALKLAAESAIQLGSSERAVDYIGQIPDDEESAVEVRCDIGELLIERKQASLALDQFRIVARQQPDHLLANQRLAFLYGLASRNREALPHRLFALQQNELSSSHVFALSLGDDFQENPEVLLQYHKAVPQDPLAKIGLARAAITRKQYVQAQQFLKDVGQSNFESIEAQVTLGRTLLELKQDQALTEWHNRLATAADEYAGIWTVRGEWARRSGNTSAAIRCWAEAVLRDPNLPEANYQLGQLLVLTGHESMAQTFLQRSQSLRQYANFCYGAVTHGGKPSQQSVSNLREAAESAEMLGLMWEARAWTQLAAQAAQSLSGDNGDLLRWATGNLTRIETELPELPTGRAIPEANPAKDFPLTNFPRFTPSGGFLQPRPITQESVDSGSIRFRNDASRSGLDFTYFNGDAPLGHGMYNFTGGGIAVLDYNKDGWPDLFFTQGSRWPPDVQSAGHLDAMFRNQGDGQFENTTAVTGIHENGYSQGVSVGDFDNDGFPDIYVANIGGNRLYRNNGDGTFRDASEFIEGDDARWTTSCVLADLNGDALPDIYSVNYLADDDVFTRVCTDIDGSIQACLPQNFAASQDQVFINLGDSRFTEATDEYGFTVPDGKGLGVVAADFQATGQLSLFVANDEVSNFFFTPTAKRKGDVHNSAFVEQALPLGVAANGLGQPEACMGIAAGDVNGDGLLDLFVTNFEHESNTLYVQRQGMLFEDATDRFELSEPGLPLLGFGTQFLDADQDGDLDLIITNGHIQKTGQERMPPQLFANQDEKRFQRVQAQQGGDYFKGRYLGRSLVRLDWNRDGLEDIAIGHLDAPVALLTNTASSSGHRLSLRLAGVSSSRDAVGAIVTLRLAGRTIVRQLTAGDGYQGNNERRLGFGLGDSHQVEELHIRWPSGAEDAFVDVPVDVELLCIEDRPFQIMRTF